MLMWEGCEKMEWLFLNPRCIKGVQGFTEIRQHLVLQVKQTAAYLTLQWINKSTYKELSKMSEKKGK